VGTFVSLEIASKEQQFGLNTVTEWWGRKPDHFPASRVNAAREAKHILLFFNWKEEACI
jgi:hypothetical protein